MKSNTRTATTEIYIKMSTAEKVAKAQELLQATNELAQTQHGMKKVCQKLARKIKADLVFLRNHEKQHKGSADVHLASSNLPYLEGILQTIKNSDGVEDVMCDIKKYSIIVDVVCDDGKTWKKIIARNPQSLHLIWAGKGQYGTKDIMRRADKYIEAANQFCGFAPPQIVFVLTNGVTHQMAQVLEDLGIKVEGERCDVAEETLHRLRMVGSDSDSDESEDLFDMARKQAENYGQDMDSESLTEENDEEEEEETYDQKSSKHIASEKRKTFNKLKKLSVDSKIFLDITTMIVYVSEVCNGGSIATFTDKVLEEQATQEREESALNKINPYMEGRTLITCESAISDFRGVLEVLAGEKEKVRAKDLIERLVVVPDWMSERVEHLIESGQIRHRSKVIFGTADRLCCDILTSNVGFLRAAAGQSMNISARTHDSRALSEKKEEDDLSLNG